MPPNYQEGSPDQRAEYQLRSLLGSERPEEFGALVAVFEKRLIHLAWRLTNDREEARQIVQEGFLRAFQHRRQFRGEAAVGTWISRIVTHLCMDWLRRRKWKMLFLSFSGRPREDANRENENPPEWESAGEEAVQEQAVFRKEIGDRLRRALEELTPRQKTVFLLMHFEGRSIAEIADLLAMEPGTVKTHAHRARLRLRKLLADLAPLPCRM